MKKYFGPDYDGVSGAPSKTFGRMAGKLISFDDHRNDSVFPRPGRNTDVTRLLVVVEDEDVQVESIYTYRAYIFIKKRIVLRNAHHFQKTIASHLLRILTWQFFQFPFQKQIHCIY